IMNIRSAVLIGQPQNKPVKYPRCAEMGGQKPTACWTKSACYRTSRVLLDEADGGGGAGVGHFFDGAELRFIARDIFAEGSPDTLGVAGADDHAFQQLALRAVWKDVDEVKGEFL